MGRPYRAAEGGYVYHVLNRGNARMRVFDDEGDFDAFEKLLAEDVERSETRLLAYCLMPRHWHLVGVDHTLRLWHLPTEQELFVLRRLDNSVFSTLDFSPDGNRLATATNDNGGYGHVLVWSLPPDAPAAWQEVSETAP